MQQTCEAPSSSSSPWGCRITNTTLACAFDNLVLPALLPSIETEVAAFEPPAHGATAWFGLGTVPRTTVEELIANVQAGSIDFDRCIATPDMMAKLGKIARVSE